MKLGLVIFGEPASKANQRQLVSFPDGKGGKRPALVKSKKAQNYERDALKQIPPAVRLQIEGPVRVTLRIFYASERPDLDESVVLDVLQDRFVKDKQLGERVLVQKGVYRNDRQVREKHVYHAIDRANPRTEIEIEALVAQQPPMFPGNEFACAFEKEVEKVIGEMGVEMIRADGLPF